MKCAVVHKPCTLVGSWESKLIKLFIRVCLRRWAADLANRWPIFTLEHMVSWWRTLLVNIFSWWTVASPWHTDVSFDLRQLQSILNHKHDEHNVRHCQLPGRTPHRRVTDTRHVANARHVDIARGDVAGAARGWVCPSLVRLGLSQWGQTANRTGRPRSTTLGECCCQTQVSPSGLVSVLLRCHLRQIMIHKTMDMWKFNSVFCC